MSVTCKHFKHIQRVCESGVGEREMSKECQVILRNYEDALFGAVGAEGRGSGSMDSINSSSGKSNRSILE